MAKDKADELKDEGIGNSALVLKVYFLQKKLNTVIKDRRYVEFVLMHIDKRYRM